MTTTNNSFGPTSVATQQLLTPEWPFSKRWPILKCGGHEKIHYAIFSFRQIENLFVFRGRTSCNAVAVTLLWYLNLALL